MSHSIAKVSTEVGAIGVIFTFSPPRSRLASAALVEEIVGAGACV
jgi:hypothetical protein